MARVRPGITVRRQRRSSLIPIPLASRIARLAVCLRENSRSPRPRAKFHSQILMVSINWANPAMPAGRPVLDRSDLVSTTRRSAAARTIRLLRLTARTRTLFIIARKIWLPRFVCAAMTEAPPMARQSRPTRRNAADCTGTLKSHLTEQFICPITAAAAQAPSSFRKITD